MAAVAVAGGTLGSCNVWVAAGRVSLGVVTGGIDGNATLCGGATVGAGPTVTQPTTSSADSAAPSVKDRCFKWFPSLTVWSMISADDSSGADDR